MMETKILNIHELKLFGKKTRSDTNSKKLHVSSTTSLPMILRYQDSCSMENWVYSNDFS